MVVEPSVEEGSEEDPAVRERTADTVSLAPVLLLYKYIMIPNFVCYCKQQTTPYTYIIRREMDSLLSAFLVISQLLIH